MQLFTLFISTVCFISGRRTVQAETPPYMLFNPLKPELNPICYLLALLAHHFLHVSRIRVKLLTFRLLMSYIYMEHPFLMFLDHTQRRSTVGRTPLDEWSARHRDLYLTTHNTTNVDAPGGIRTHNLSRRVAADLWLGPIGTVTGYYMEISLSRLKRYRSS